MNRRTLFALPLVALVPTAELSEGDRLLLDTTQLLGQVSAATDKFSVVSQYLTQRQAVQTYIEKVYSGSTVDWSQLPAQLKAK